MPQKNKLEEKGRIFNMKYCSLPNTVNDIPEICNDVEIKVIKSEWTPNNSIVQIESQNFIPLFEKFGIQLEKEYHQLDIKEIEETIIPQIRSKEKKIFLTEDQIVEDFLDYAGDSLFSKGGTLRGSLSENAKKHFKDLSELARKNLKLLHQEEPDVNEIEKQQKKLIILKNSSY